MNLINIGRCYITMNIMIILSSLILTACIFLNKFLTRKVRYRHLLRFSYCLFAVSLFLPLILIFQAPGKIWSPTTQVWSAPNIKTLIASSPAAVTKNEVAMSFGSQFGSLPLDNIALGFAVALTISFFWHGMRLFRDLNILFKILNNGFLVKKIGRVKVITTERISIPFSAWLPFCAYVVVPQTLIEDRKRWTLIVKHELQHHRQRDTKWVYVQQLAKVLCFWNPAVFILDKKIADLQEVACDEALIGRQGISSKVYCDCLLWVAQQSMLSRNCGQLVGTTGFAHGSAAKLLKWRINEMISTRKKNFSAVFVMGLGLSVIGLLSVAGAATHGSIQDRRVTLADAQKMAESATNDKFPLIVNDLVLAQLNKYLGTPDGREFMRSSLKRMKKFEGEIIEHLDQYQLPHELLAVPLVESGYRNLPDDGNASHGAGIWMFTAGTAREFGLRVNATVDERLDVTLETDAAMRVLGGLNLQFRDWGLALLGYNAGPRFVTKAISQVGSRDVWQLIREGYENDPRYVASVMAVALIMQNPSSLD